ncbi:uncharacterized protein MONOS_12094c2 [Monocercomonoides exilis]|uniref:uncharacterized protein n=1 Tax=Monocercomonoides exilis TaxID=2049356 RepID=UPI003559C075|nr:hypothetical protein MONOS_12094c1 [Monocercomonoides exilis]KAH7829300.1 hypothetical protein MONOS_12094c2 [Monocercomonoides exilis]|eukprot:MONOS_12094.1-p1 / transcript=MONOS_12094.1 / gene=MONOS_12094 / organism=Monocercomonoides_exilis_PA203 / gene_product=unspecified product / transcript_product=unspecified product / location=Mono_scaffold00645:2319-2825(+) / protein_length=169 / sequence_SO=supercontig / SO=protein_coding / is_pseudo=false
MAPPLDFPSVHESLSPVVLDPLHSHQVNVFVPFSVSFCLPGVNFLSEVPSQTTFLVLQHLIKEVFEAVREAKGLLREVTIPPSYVSQTDENEQLFIKYVVWDEEVVEGEHASFAVEMLKNVSCEKETRGMKTHENNWQKEEKCNSHTKILSSTLSSLPLPLGAIWQNI